MLDDRYPSARSDIFRVRFILLRLNMPNTALALQVWPSAASAISFLNPFNF
ncbi:MAG: hypothetical protein BWY28_01888 [bacterium ADurb.Bin236]|nr:MAG: hypothetical protein BWY28_01888 [bacterium ADurb.Bin236]